MKHLFASFALLLLAATQLSAAAASFTPDEPFTLSIDNPSGRYSRNQKATIKCSFEMPLLDTFTVRIYKNSKVVSEDKLCLASRTDGGWKIPSEVTLLEQSYDETCHVYVEMESKKYATRGVGFLVEPEGFRPAYSEPADMMQWWEKQKKQLRKMPMNLKVKDLDVPDQYKGKYICQDIEADCLGPESMKAYFSKPVGAKKKSLPIIILCRAAGVAGDWCRCQVGECVGNAALGNGALSLDLNAHGMENGHDTDYYKALEDGPLHDYWNIGISDRDDFYFHGMYLRVLRAIEFMTKQPEWDGKRILVIGESQGGGQAAAVAGLDSRVSAVVLNVPALMDLGAPKAGRRAGWPQPIESHDELTQAQLDAVLPYFDAALLLAHSKAEIFCEIGLIDTTCPAPSIYSGLNGAKGKKTINLVTYRTHAWPDGKVRPSWDKDFYYPRLEFINNYLK